MSYGYAYEQEIQQMFQKYTSQYGKLKEVKTDDGDIELVFERGSVSKPQMMKYGYMGTGTKCFFMFLREAGFNVTLEEIENLKDPFVLKP